MDLVESLLTSKGNNAICVVVDRLSKYAHFLPLYHPSSTIDMVTIFIWEIIHLHGIPHSIAFDCYTIFLSSMWNEIHYLQGTKLNSSTTFHPKIEASQNVLTIVWGHLRCFIYDQPNKWSKWLLWVELWFNTTFHQSLKTSPSSHMFWVYLN